jgi:hypothetical protein
VVIRALDDSDGGSFSLVGMSPKEMRESQQRDPDLSQFCQWLSTGGGGVWGAGQRRVVPSEPSPETSLDQPGFVYEGR